MAEKMTRRTFMKSAAAAAAAISLSGVLTGCGGSGQLADDEVQIGPFTVRSLVWMWIWARNRHGQGCHHRQGETAL